MIHCSQGLQQWQRASAAALATVLLTPALAACSALEITAISANAPAAIRESFRKQIDVFGVHLYAMAGVPDAKLRHAAGVMAQYLDNDADGVADNGRIASRMQRSGAAMILFADQDEADTFFDSLNEGDLDGTVLQDLYVDEIHPDGAAKGRFDASLEEVLHLITHVGYARVYPRQFGETAGSKLTRAMDVARGGHFEQVPETYSPGAWYTYGDHTCDYGCMATEYAYWGLTSILGAQSFPGRAERIAAEWRLNTATLVKATDRRLWRLLTRKRFKLPRVLPDGKYRVEPGGGS